MELEEAVGEAIGQAGEVDGHDIGGGEMNIFVLTEDPRQAFDKIQCVFSSRGLLSVLKVAYREVDGEEYVPIFPAGLRQFSVV